MNDKEEIRLLLLPYAGGSGLLYSRWSKYLDKHIKMVPIELPGRGLRFKEKLCEQYGISLSVCGCKDERFKETDIEWICHPFNRK